MRIAPDVCGGRERGGAPEFKRDCSRKHGAGKGYHKKQTLTVLV